MRARLAETSWSITVSEPDIEDRWRGWLEFEEGECDDLRVALLVVDLVSEIRDEGCGLWVWVEDTLGCDEPETLVDGERREDIGLRGSGASTLAELSGDRSKN